MIGARTDADGVQIWVATAPVDMRKSFDGLMEVVRSFLGHNPLSGSMFVFRNRAGHMLKILWWDRDGLAIYYKKLETEDTQNFGFTEVGRRAHNQHAGAVEAPQEGRGQMVGGAVEA